MVCNFYKYFRNEWHASNQSSCSLGSYILLIVSLKRVYEFRSSDRKTKVTMDKKQVIHQPASELPDLEVQYITTASIVTRQAANNNCE